MHYKNGRLAKAGDKVICLAPHNHGIAGILHSINVQSDTCNGRVAVTTAGDPYVTLRECLHVDDIAAASIPSTAVAAIEAEAARLYARYCEAVGGRAFNGDPLPDWATFAADPAKAKQAEAWRVVADAARAGS